MFTTKDKIVFFLERIKSGELFVKDGVLYDKNGKEKGSLNKDGYKRYSSRIQGKRIEVFGHRLMFAYYHGVDALDDDKVIDHKDGDKLNNKRHNLEQITLEENNKRAVANGLNGFKGEKHPRTNLTDEKVREIKVKIKQGADPEDIQSEFDISVYVFYDIEKERNWKHITI